VWGDLRHLAAEAERTQLAPEASDLLVLVGDPSGLGLRDQEAMIVDLLGERPHSVLALSRACGCVAPQLLRCRRLERIGLVRRSAATPTDALHVLGVYTPYDVEAAALGVELVGRRIGLGDVEAAQAVVREVECRAALAIMRRELNTDGRADGEERFQRAYDLLEHVASREEQEGFELSWRQVRPVVGIGAPVGAFLPGACKRLGIEAIVPDDADVANAVGAVVSQVLVSETIRIRHSEFGGYVLFAPDGRQEFARLEEAATAAHEHVVTLVRRRAAGFGTNEGQVRVSVTERTGRVSDGSTQLLEVKVCGQLVGAPTVAGAPA
jgi:N-methylhydantoinase A/oxoprolinase/acetone carboxylase beta subunit